MPFKIEEKIKGSLGRTGKISTVHGAIETPNFAVVGTKATVKSLTPEQVKSTGTQVVLGNTYHLYLQPGEDVVREAGGMGKYMNWEGPTITDSGGFQVFSLGAAIGRSVSKIAKKEDENTECKELIIPLMNIDDEGVSFRSHIDGSPHRFTPEKSIEIQHALGADIMFAFDECTSPHAGTKYQREALDRTHAWALRSLSAHKKIGKAGSTATELWGIVQGGREIELREKSAKIIGAMNFDGFGIGGSFDKEDVGEVVACVNRLLPEELPRHFLGIGEPLDILKAVENGCDMFDCVLPTRWGRNGTLMTRYGRMSIENAEFRSDFTPIEDDCSCYSCLHFTRSYLHHLFRAKEMLASTLATIHNLRFMMSFMEEVRSAIREKNYTNFKEKFIASYSKVKTS